jgi:hypothetical protein
MLPPPGVWGEAALDVRFVTAHRGRRLITEPKRKRGNPSLGGQNPLKYIDSFEFFIVCIAGISQVEETENLSTAAMRPPGDRVVTGDHCRTPSYNGPNAAKMRLCVTLTTAVTPPHPPSHGTPVNKAPLHPRRGFCFTPVGGNRRGTTATIVGPDRNTVAQTPHRGFHLGLQSRFLKPTATGWIANRTVARRSTGTKCRERPRSASRDRPQIERAQLLAAPYSIRPRTGGLGGWEWPDADQCCADAIVPAELSPESHRDSGRHGVG